jgi:transposase-like protein
MSISPTLLSQWQNLAMEGMLSALSPKRPQQQTPLSSRLSKLIEKNLPDPTAKLQKRLKAIQGSRAS